VQAPILGRLSEHRKINHGFLMGIGFCCRISQDPLRALNGRLGTRTCRLSANQSVITRLPMTHSSSINDFGFVRSKKHKVGSSLARTGETDRTHRAVVSPPDAPRWRYHRNSDQYQSADTIHCAWIVPKDVGSGDLSDSSDFGISNLHVFNMRVRFAPPLPAPYKTKELS